jgi:phosphatidate cytidylyltransferase
MSASQKGTSRDRARQVAHTARQVAADTKDHAKMVAIDKTPKKFKNPTNLQVRFRTGFVYVVLSIICLLANDVTAVIYLSTVAAICAGEFYYMLRSDAKLPNEMLGIIAAVLYPVSVWVMGLEGALLVTLALTVALIIWYVYWMRARIPDVGVSLFGAVYTGMMLSGFVLVRGTLPEPWGGVLVLMIMLSVWANDACAYFIGSKFGRHKLAPRTSPKKSWEGLFAGLVASAFIWFLMSLIPGVTMPWPEAIVLGLICGVMSVIGDLAESRIKRNVGVKDSGTIMPGHGGLLDRCDSLFMAAVTAALLLIMGGCVPFVR